MPFGLIVSSREVPAYNGHILTQEDERFFVTNEEGGWVEATSTSVKFVERLERKIGVVPKEIKVFKTREAAEKFGKRWKGHPWYVQPKDFEVIELAPVTARVSWKRV
jgi:hypothetical protein